MKNLILVISSLFIFLNVSCEKADEGDQTTCVKGKYIGTYCEGMAIEIIDDNKIGSDFIGMFDNKKYTNTIIASVDSVLLNSMQNPDAYFTKDSIFYFKYKNGGYPRLTYNICEPSSSITLTYISKQPCNEIK